MTVNRILQLNSFIAVLTSLAGGASAQVLVHAGDVGESLKMTPHGTGNAYLSTSIPTEELQRLTAKVPTPRPTKAKNLAALKLPTQTVSGPVQPNPDTQYKIVRTEHLLKYTPGG